MRIRPLFYLGLLALVVQLISSAAGFTPLVKISTPALVNPPAAYPNGPWRIENLIDGDPKTEFASASLGTNTVVEFIFTEPARIAAIRHLDRNDPATIAASEFQFFGEGGTEAGRVAMRHAQTRRGETFLVLSEPVTAIRVRWRVTEQSVANLPALGGAELAFYTLGSEETAPSTVKTAAELLPFVRKAGAQPVRLAMDYLYTKPADVRFRLGGEEIFRATLKPGSNVIELLLPEVRFPTERTLAVFSEGQKIASTEFVQDPVRHLTVYITPHSHTDIGYTEVQTAIEAKQVQNLVDGMAAARRTADYPDGARFVWNVEVGWAADLYLQRLDATQREEFLDAVRAGRVVLNGMYLNELTGLCRPEELIQLFRFSTRMAEMTGVPIDTAMISDVPGYTWGTVTAMAQAGIKYFSTAPNYFDRIGTILREWENKPFYWVGPDGKSKVLVWIPFWGYAMSHKYHSMSERLVTDLYEGLEKKSYPFEIAYVRWSGHGDNAVPDPAICEFVRDWNAKYEWPKFRVAGASEAFRAFEKKYGDQLPRVRGDWSPYWEDGAGSSARETALNRNTADRLSAAATAFAILKPSEYPVDQFEDAWRKVLLYSEHTWGAWCSVTEPARKETLEQWEIKKSYAEQADRATASLLASALKTAAEGNGVEVVNTLSWSRSELVLIPADLSRAGDRVSDTEGRPLPSQRLQSGELAFVAQDVPPFATRTYVVSSGAPAVPAICAKAEGTTLDNGQVRLRVDQRTGGINELTAESIPVDMVEHSGGESLNDYIYFQGDEPKSAQKTGDVKISIGEPGPLIASLVIESAAPGAKRLIREVRLIAAKDHVELNNTVDKERLDAKSYMAREGKESANFAFPLNVPEGEMLVDVPLGAFHPDDDQIASACKNWLTVGRWVEVANKNYGVSWVTLDAPLIEVGVISATLLNSQTNPDVWRTRIGPSQKFYSWAMNNHWGTNYRAYQEGLATFRYVLRPHARGTDPAEATRFATGFSTPLLVRRAAKGQAQSLLQLSNRDVLVTGLKPSDDGKAIIIRLFGASGRDQSTALRWGSPVPKNIYLSGTSEQPEKRAGPEINVPGYGLVTLRAEMK